jgi:hypothetical protein
VRIATRRLGLKQRVEYLGSASFEVAVSLESALQQILDSLLRFRPRQRGLKRSDGGEQRVGGRQRDMVDEILRGSNGTPVEEGDPARESVNEAIQFRGVLSSMAALAPLAVLTAAVCSVRGCGGPKAAPAIPRTEVEVASVVIPLESVSGR